MSDYTGYNMPTGCSNMDIPGFDCSDDDPDYTVDDYEPENELCAKCGSDLPCECKEEANV